MTTSDRLQLLAQRRALVADLNDKMTRSLVEAQIKIIDGQLAKGGR